jgi:hypothetical protein
MWHEDAFAVAAILIFAAIVLVVALIVMRY